MAREAPDWHLFRAFLAVVREGSLSGAARALGTTQPTMGRQVAALEKALGVKLFTRSLEGLAPTEAGLSLLPSAEAMAAAAAAATRCVSAAPTQERGTVRITASEVMGGEVLPPILARLRALHPLITLELSLSNRNEDLLRRDADIAVRMLRPTQGSLVARRIGRIDAGLYAHRRYLKANGTPQRLDDLRQHALIGFDRNASYARMIQRAGVALSREEFAFRSDSDLAQLAALRAGLGIGPCQMRLAAKDTDLVPVLQDALNFSMDMWLAMHRDLRSILRFRLTFDHLGTELAAYARTGPGGA